MEEGVKVDSWWHYWFHTIMASLAYILAHIADYFFTVFGILKKLSQEANPVVQGYIEAFGLFSGIVICKVLMCTIIILGVIVTRLAYRAKGVEFRVEFVLYLGAFMTFFGGALWLIRL